MTSPTYPLLTSYPMSIYPLPRQSSSPCPFQHPSSPPYHHDTHAHHNVNNHDRHHDRHVHSHNHHTSPYPTHGHHHVNNHDRHQYHDHHVHFHDAHHNHQHIALFFIRDSFKSIDPREEHINATTKSQASRSQDISRQTLFSPVFPR